MPEIRRIVHELLAQLGSSREAQQYLKEYSGTNQARFAVVKVGGGILRDHRDELTAALAFLHRLGLIPVVLHGAGPQLDKALTDAGIDAERHDGLRVTSESVGRKPSRRNDGWPTEISTASLISSGGRVCRLAMRQSYRVSARIRLPSAVGNLSVVGTRSQRQGQAAKPQWVKLRW